MGKTKISAEAKTDTEKQLWKDMELILFGSFIRDIKNLIRAMSIHYAKKIMMNVSKPTSMKIKHIQGYTFIG